MSLLFMLLFLPLLMVSDAIACYVGLRVRGHVGRHASVTQVLDAIHQRLEPRHYIPLFGGWVYLFETLWSNE